MNKRRIFATGDLHGSMDIKYLNTFYFPQQKKLSKNDVLFILGDFGLYWDLSREDRYWINWLDKAKYSTIVILGNHEHYENIYSLPKINKYGAEGYRLSESIFIVEHGEIITLGTDKYFCFGGATSIDKNVRIPGVDWFKEEIPSVKLFDKGLSNLDTVNWEIDYVLSHTCQTSLVPIMSKSNYIYKCPVSDYLEVILKKLKYKHHYFGHFHQLPKSKELGL